MLTFFFLRRSGDPVVKHLNTFVGSETHGHRQQLNDANESREERSPVVRQYDLRRTRYSQLVTEDNSLFRPRPPIVDSTNIFQCDIETRLSYRDVMIKNKDLCESDYIVADREWVVGVTSLVRGFFVHIVRILSDVRLINHVNSLLLHILKDSTQCRPKTTTVEVGGSPLRVKSTSSLARIARQIVGCCLR